MARLRILVVAQETDGDVYALATCKFYQPGTATASGSSTSGTPFSGNLYAAIAGGSPISTTQTLGSNGTLAVWTTTKGRVDVGIEPAGGGTAFVRQYDAAELDPADVLTLLDTQLVMPTGTLAAPSLAWTSDLDTGFNVDSDGDVGVSKDGVGILETISTTTYLRSPDGTKAAALSDTGLFSTPGLLSKLHGWDLEMDGGLTPGTNTADAAANATAFHALRDRIATIGYGDILVKQEFPISPINLHHALSGDRPINIVGYPGRGQLRFHGATGPFLSVGASGSAMQRCGLYDLDMVHTSVVTSGATVLIGSDAPYFQIIDGGIFNRGSGEAALIGIQVEGAQPRIRGAKIELRTDESTLGVLVPVGIDMQTTGTVGGPDIFDVSIDGCINKSYAVRFAHSSGTIDTPRFSRCHFKDHERGIVHSSAGSVANLQSSDLYLDVITGTGLHVEPSGDFIVATFVNTWMAAADRPALLSGSNGGDVRGFSFLGGYWTDSTLPVVVSGHSTVSRHKFIGLEILSQVGATGEYALDVGGASDPAKAITVKGCTVQVLGTALGAARFSSAGTGMVVQGNTWVGVTANIGFSNGTDNNKDGNVFISSL